MKCMELKKLDDSQLVKFNQEYVNSNLWEMVITCIRKQFPEGDFSFVDLGGGNGLFTDRLLNEFPKSRATLIDNSKYLIAINQKHPRKTIICDSIENTHKYVKNADLIFYNWLLHHLVSDAYITTRKNIDRTLFTAKTLLSNRGRISIFENMYDGIYFDKLPSRLIFNLSSSKLLAPFIRKLGANTAGCGVCFLSQLEWVDTITKVGLSVDKYSDDEPWTNISLYKKLILHLGPVRVGHFWVKGRHQYG